MRITLFLLTMLFSFQSFSSTVSYTLNLAANEFEATCEKGFLHLNIPRIANLTRHQWTQFQKNTGFRALCEMHEENIQNLSKLKVTLIIETGEMESRSSCSCDSDKCLKTKTFSLYEKIEVQLKDYLKDTFGDFRFLGPSYPWIYVPGTERSETKIASWEECNPGGQD